MLLSRSRKTILLCFVAVFALGGAVNALAQTYQVTVTNLTRGESFTPRLATTHAAGNFFQVGEPVIEEVAVLAESGAVDQLVALLEGEPDFVSDTVVMPGLLAPGASEEFMIQASAGDRLSLLNMLIPSNDAFMALDAVSLPETGTVVFNIPVYDAGSEPNDELCSNIPGPTCGGQGDSPMVDGEGYAHIHAGIHGGGDLAVADFDWRNPAARITVTRMP